MKNYIECPNCKTQYYPDEIFVWSEEFKNYTNTKTKNKLDEICDTLTEKYICDNCDTQFKITAKLCYQTSIDSKFNFTNGYQTQLKKSFILEED